MDVIIDGIKQTNINVASCFIQAAFKFAGDASAVSMSIRMNSFEMVYE